MAKLDARSTGLGEITVLLLSRRLRLGAASLPLAGRDAHGFAGRRNLQARAKTPTGPKDRSASGLPDDSISRALGISHRTMQRRLHRLQQRLHAPTRFQLPYRRGRRGWL